MSMELIWNNESKAPNLNDQLFQAKDELFQSFLVCMWEKSAQGAKILDLFGIVLNHFDKESLKIEKNDLNAFIWTFLREMEVDEVNIRNFQRKYMKYMIYKTSKETADRVIEKMLRKERVI